ncbi:MAG: hypothetical protein AB7U83_04535 [Vicinamibacterales bacterium]
MPLPRVSPATAAPGRALLVLTVVLAALTGRPAAAQDTDPLFTATTNDVVRAVAVQSDGRIVIGGFFAQVNGVGKAFLARLMPDGSLDGSFTTVLDGFVETVVVQPDGKILIGGGFSTVNGVSAPALARLNAADGSRDGSFASPIPSVLTTVNAVLRQADGQIVAAGFRPSTQAVVRFTDAGAVDAGFTPGTPNGSVLALAQQTDGRLLVGGTFTGIGGVARGGVARLEATGALDSSFTTTVSLGAGHGVYAMALRSNGTLLLGGRFTSFNGQPRNGLALVDAAGQLDPAFVVSSATGGVDNVQDIVVQPDGDILLAGNFVGFGQPSSAKLVRVDGTGTIDPSFVPRTFLGAGCCNGYVAAIALQADGKVLAGGSYAPATIVRLPAAIPNLPPTISAIADRTLVGAAGELLSTGPMAFTVGDPEGRSVTVSAASSDAGVVPPAGITFGGSGANRTLTIQPAAAAQGQSTITVVAHDGPLQASTSFVVTVERVAANAPRSLAVSLVDGRIRLTWQPPVQGTVTGYVVEAGNTSGATTVSAPVGNTLGLDASAPPATYFIRVRAQTTAGLGGPSNEVSVRTDVAPLPPLDFRAAVAGNAVSLQWGGNPQGTSPTAYELRAGTGPGLSDIVVLPLPSTARSLNVTAPTGTYFLRLAAVNAFGASPSAPEISIAPGPGACSPRPAAPTGLAATPAAGQVTITWNPAAGAIGYELAAGSSPGASDIGRFPLPAVASITAAAPSGQYYVRLVARSAGACTSDPSGEIAFVVP